MKKVDKILTLNEYSFGRYCPYSLPKSSSCLNSSSKVLN